MSREFLMLARLLPVAFVAATQLDAQTASGIERAAALRFAVNNGLDVSPNVVVAVETIADSANPRAAATRVAMRGQDAQTLASLIGADVRTASVAGLVECASRSCWATSLTPVLLVSDPETVKDGRTQVLLTYFFNSVVDGALIRNRTLAVVNVVKEGPAGWLGTEFANGPSTVTKR